MTLFRMIRHEDVSGVSGTGIVAYGTVFPNGKVAVAWTVPGKPQTVTIYDSFEDVKALHLHGGKTEIDPIWRDD